MELLPTRLKRRRISIGDLTGDLISDEERGGGLFNGRTVPVGGSAVGAGTVDARDCEAMMTREELEQFKLETN